MRLELLCRHAPALVLRRGKLDGRLAARRLFRPVLQVPVLRVRCLSLGSSRHRRRAAWLRHRGGGAWLRQRRGSTWRRQLLLRLLRASLERGGCGRLLRLLLGHTVPLESEAEADRYSHHRPLAPTALSHHVHRPAHAPELHRGVGDRVVGRAEVLVHQTEPQHERRRRGGVGRLGKRKLKRVVPRRVCSVEQVLRACSAEDLPAHEHLEDDVRVRVLRLAGRRRVHVGHPGGVDAAQLQRAA